jgi:hypothetical protein
MADHLNDSYAQLDDIFGKPELIKTDLPKEKIIEIQKEVDETFADILEMLKKKEEEAKPNELEKSDENTNLDNTNTTTEGITTPSGGKRRSRRKSRRKSRKSRKSKKSKRKSHRRRTHRKTKK